MKCVYHIPNGVINDMVGGVNDTIIRMISTPQFYLSHHLIWYACFILQCMKYDFYCNKPQNNINMNVNYIQNAVLLLIAIECQPYKPLPVKSRRVEVHSR